MAGSDKISPIPDEVKNFIRSVLLSKPKGQEMVRLPRDYKELVGERLNFYRWGAQSLVSFLQKMPDVVRLVKKDGSYWVHGIPDSNSYQNISMKKATRALAKLSVSSNTESNVSKPRPSAPLTNGVISKNPKIQDLSKQLEPDLRGFLSICFRIKPGFTKTRIQEDFSKYGEVREISESKSYYFVRYKTRLEAAEAMFHLHSQYDVVPAKANSKVQRQVLLRNAKVERRLKVKEEPMESNGFNDTISKGESETTIDVCVENLPPDISKGDIGELLQLANIPSKVLVSLDVFSKLDSSFAYLRVKSARNARNVARALQNITWRGFEVRAKMPDHAQSSMPVPRSFSGRTVIDTSRHIVGSMVREAGSDSDSPGEEEMPELEASTFEDDDAFERRHYAAAEEDVIVEENEDDYGEMPELEPLPELDRVPEQLGPITALNPAPELNTVPEQSPVPELSPTPQLDHVPQSTPVPAATEQPKTTGMGAGKPVLTVKNFPGKTTRDELVELFAPYKPRCVLRISDNYDQLAGKVTFYDMETLFQALSDLDGSDFNGKRLMVYRSDTQASKSGTRIKEARSLTCTVVKDTKGAIDPGYQPGSHNYRGRAPLLPCPPLLPLAPARQPRPPLLPLPVVQMTPSQSWGFRPPGHVGPFQPDRRIGMMRQDINLVIQQMMQTCFPGIPFWGPGDLPEDFEVIVTCVMSSSNPAVFWGQLISRDAREDVKKLFSMQEEFPRVAEIYRGQPHCAAKYMGEYRRACVLSHVPPGKVKVFFLDYGNISVQFLSEIRSLPERYWSLPPQALPFMSETNFVGNICEDDVLVACVKPPPPFWGEQSSVIPIALLLKKTPMVM